MVQRCGIYLKRLVHFRKYWWDNAVDLSNMVSSITSQGAERIVYGRGSPEMNFTAKLANTDIQWKFEGALPTTIYQTGFLEIYGMNPDIDSTALMIATTSWILARYIKVKRTYSNKNALYLKVHYCDRSHIPYIQKLSLNICQIILRLYYLKLVLWHMH